MNVIRLGVVILLFFISGIVLPVFAARSLSVTANKSSLFGDEELTVTASASGFTDGETIHIKGAFFQEGSTNYFGYTKNSANWIKNGETTTSQRSIIIGQWDQTLIVKSDFSDSGYKGEGDYKVKVGFYYTTSGGNLSGVNWSGNALTVSLSEPDPTPTNSPTPTCTPTNTPQSTSTNTPKPTNTLTPKPTEKETATPTQRTSETSTSSGQNRKEGEVLGAKEGNTATSSVTMERAASKKVFIITFLFIGIGCAILSLTFVLRKQFFSS